MEKEDTDTFLKHMAFLLKEILSNGFIIIKPLKMKVYNVLDKMIYILSKTTFCCRIIFIK